MKHDTALAVAYSFIGVHHSGLAPEQKHRTLLSTPSTSEPTISTPITTHAHADSDGTPKQDAEGSEGDAGGADGGDGGGGGGD